MQLSQSSALHLSFPVEATLPATFIQAFSCVNIWARVVTNPVCISLILF